MMEIIEKAADNAAFYIYMQKWKTRFYKLSSAALIVAKLLITGVTVSID